MPQSDYTPELTEAMAERILLLDGAMGTTVRDYGLGEKEVRGERFANATKDLLNNGDILSLTKPEVILDIHSRFFEAGSDICETNTFSATTISQSEFFVDDPRETGGRKDQDFFQKIIEDPHLLELVHDLNFESARLCREAADRVANKTGRQRFVAGAIGPMTVSLTNSPDANDPAFRVVNFDQVLESYKGQVRALIAGGCDLLMIETIFDSLNAKAAAVAIQEVYEEVGAKLPIILSAAVGRGGETMISAQKVEGFWNAFSHIKPLAIGLNCSMGPDLMQTHLEELTQCATTHISCYPNAGLPNPLAPTGFDFEPDDMAHYMGKFAQEGLLNIAGGCCGNTPEHISAIAKAVENQAPREVPRYDSSPSNQHS
ncbi:MAG: homocysteine S-methyltransferase family protein [Luteolibacter sp.]